MADIDDPLCKPVGEADPNVIYIAVGRAIHSWEGLEEALSRLYLHLSGLDDTPPNLMAFGKRYGTTQKRFAAIERAAKARFADSAGVEEEAEAEAELAAILAAANDLRIERHRIAHGHIAMWAEFGLPVAPGSIPLTGRVLYRWAPPFYGVEKLRTTAFGLNGAEMDALADRFMDLHNRVYALTMRLFPPAPTPETPQSQA